MKGFTVAFEDLEFGIPHAPQDVAFEVQRYSFSAVGGPLACEIDCSGSEEGLWNLTRMLRYGITVHDDRSERRWWGYVSGVTITVGRLEYSISLDSMANRVKVKYTLHTYDDQGQDTSEARESEWELDTESVYQFGIKETVLSLQDSTEHAAQSKAYNHLQIVKNPIPEVTVAGGDASEVTATLTCRGWWDTLRWRRFSNPETLVGSVDPPSGNVQLIEMSPYKYDKVMARFIASSWRVNSASFKVQKVGQPQGMLRCFVVGPVPESSPDLPGSYPVLGYADVNLSHLPDDPPQPPAPPKENESDPDPPTPDDPPPADPVVVTFSMPNIPLTAGGRYYIGVTIVPYVDDDLVSHLVWGASHYVNVCVTTDTLGLAGTLVQYGTYGSYPGGNVEIRYGPWANNTFYTVICQITGMVQTTDLLANVLSVSEGGQFFTGLFVDAPSDVWTSAYEDGESDGRVVAEELLAMGSSTAFRLLASVLPNRSVFIYPEPLVGSDDRFILRTGELRDKYDQRIEARSCPVGQWFKLKDIIAATANTNLLANATTVFFDECEYNVESDTYTPRTRAAASVWSVGE